MSGGRVVARLTNARFSLHDVAMRAPAVFTISPALPFLETFVAELMAGRVIEGFAPVDDPLALAAATIYVPTQRAARALSEVFLRDARARGGGSVLLPRILPLGALDDGERPDALGRSHDDVEVESVGLPTAATPIWRRLQLATLIQAWALAIGGALRGIDETGAPMIDPTEAFRVATSTVDAVHLAADLAALIDELLIEDVPWRDLDPLSLPEFDEYWRITTTFLSIAVDQWPLVLARHGVVDPARRQIALVEAQIRTLEARASGTPGAVQRGPVIAIGSTGTNKATARLLAAIARAPAGAVVLPGLDRDLEQDAWAIVSGAKRPDQEPSFGHPQAAMARLLPILGIDRAAVTELGVVETRAGTRARFVSEALRPADTTDRWQAYRAGLAAKALEEALADVSLIVATDEREEALCLAVAMREILETPDRTGALITPDRDLARRVRGELLRWGIEVADTGGEPLADRPLGILARLVVSAVASRCAARDMSALLAHPMTRLGEDRAVVAARAVQIEIGVLRAVAVGGKTEARLFDEARVAATGYHAHPAQAAIADEDWRAMASVWARLNDGLAPLRGLERDQPLDAWIAAHRAALAALVGDVANEDTAALATLFTALEEQTDSPLRFTADTYAVFFGRMAGEVMLRNTRVPHPRLQIFGLLEARLMRADVILLGGLDETVWPPQARTDPFLNRPMRKALGLTPPERRLGQTAHDFAQAMGGATMILSRAAKRGGSPCVPSRFLLRLEALGPEAWRACQRRGARYSELARRLDQPDAPPAPIARPHPKPPLALRPKRLSVTQIETLRRDPYAIFAMKILRLAPLPRATETIDASQYGSIVHDGLRDFVLKRPANADIGESRALLHGLMRTDFGSVLDDPVFAAIRWPGLMKAIEVFLGFDAKQRETLRESHVERSGSLAIGLVDGSIFNLDARADRIDRHRGGRATIIDYKTGQPPSPKEVSVGFAPQLTLEAAMLKRGAFGIPPDGSIAAIYVKLGGKNGGAVTELKMNGDGFDAVVESHYAGLVALLSSFTSVDIGYLARPFPKYARKNGDYDHLARVREWSLAGDDDAGGQDGGS